MDRTDDPRSTIATWGFTRPTGWPRPLSREVRHDARGRWHTYRRATRQLRRDLDELLTAWCTDFGKPLRLRWVPVHHQAELLAARSWQPPRPP